MKKFIALPILLVFLIGCVGLQLNDTQSILGEIAARRVAYSLAKSDPEIIYPGLAICDGILNSSGELASTLANSAFLLLIDKVGASSDPMLKADMATLLSLINISTPGAFSDPVVLKAAVSAFKVGLEAAKDRE